LSYRWEESTSGPPRKYYCITPKGTQFYTDLSHTWQELQQAVSLLTQITKS
jgi:PadR family transcriptional regulator PadR